MNNNSGADGFSNTVSPVEIPFTLPLSALISEDAVNVNTESEVFWTTDSVSFVPNNNTNCDVVSGLTVNALSTVAVLVEAFQSVIVLLSPFDVPPVIAIVKPTYASVTPE